MKRGKTPRLLDKGADSALDYAVPLVRHASRRGDELLRLDFKRSKVISVSRAQGKVMSVQFELEGQRFMALNAGPLYKFTEAISFFVGCDTQQEIDELWGKLVADGGEPSRCGWLKDKFGLSWQIIPNTLGQMLGDKDPAKAGRAMTAMMQMGKLDLEQLQKAYEGLACRPAAGAKPPRHNEGVPPFRSVLCLGAASAPRRWCRTRARSHSGHAP